MATITLKIATVDRTDYLKINTGRITREVNGRARFGGVLEEIGRGYRPVKGNVLEIIEDGTIVFKGNIRRIVERAHPGTEYLQYDLECLDFNAIALRRLVTAEFPSGTVLFKVVQAVRDQFLLGENITLNNVVNPGPTIAEALRFYYETVKSVFDRLSTVTGLIWYIDFDKDLHFHQVGASPAPQAPFAITWSSGNWYDFEVESSDEDYRNRQWVRTEGGLERTLTESSVLQSGQTTVQAQAIIRELLEVRINGAVRTFVRLDPYIPDIVPGSGYDFYYWYDGQGVYALDYTPVAGHVEQIKYRGIFSSNIAVANDLTEQAARATAENGSGIWEAIREQRSIGGPNAMLAIAEGDLRQYSNDALRPRFSTDESGLEPGQYISINMTPVHDDVAGVFTIERLDYDWVAGGSLSDGRDFFRHRVQCTSVEPFGEPASWFEKLAEMARIGPPDGEGGTTDETPQAERAGRATWHIRGDLVPGRNNTNHHEIVRDGIPFSAWASTLDGEPTGNCEIDVIHIDATGIETSIFNSPLILPSGAKRSNEAVFVSPSIVFQERDFLRLNVIAPANARNVQVTVQYD